MHYDNIYPSLSRSTMDKIIMRATRLDCAPRFVLFSYIQLGPKKFTWHSLLVLVAHSNFRQCRQYCENWTWSKSPRDQSQEQGSSFDSNARQVFLRSSLHMNIIIEIFTLYQGYIVFNKWGIVQYKLSSKTAKLVSLTCEFLNRNSTCLWRGLACEVLALLTRNCAISIFFCRVFV